MLHAQNNSPQLSSVGTGYCITQELQAHSQGCLATTGQSQQCLPNELCFHEVRQRGRHLLQDSSKSRLTILNKSGYNLNADDDLLVTVRGNAEKKLSLDGLEADPGICVGIRYKFGISATSTFVGAMSKCNKAK